MFNKSSIIRILTLLLSVLTFIAGSAYFVYLSREAKEFSIKPNYIYLGFSILLFLVFYFLLSINWSLIVSNVIGKPHKMQALAFFASQPYKYLPTSLFTFSFRAKYSYDLGITLKNSTVAQIIENVVLISSAVFLALVLYLLELNLLYVLILFLALGVLLNFMPSSMKLGIKKFKFEHNKKYLLYYYALAVIAWITAGLSFSLLVKSLGLELSTLDSIIYNSLSYSAGILAFFSPGGIGIREGLYTIFGVASIAIIAWRLLTLVIDFVTGSLAILMIRHLRKD